MQNAIPLAVKNLDSKLTAPLLLVKCGAVAVAVLAYRQAA